MSDHDHSTQEGAQYPYVTCDQHGRQLGICVCKCVMRGERKADDPIMPTEDSAGEGVCEECKKLPKNVLLGNSAMICIAHYRFINKIQ